jgi:hypothetical protein
MRTSVLLFLVLLLLASRGVAQEQHLATPPLSSAARMLVQLKMANHSTQMTGLVWAVVLLDYGRTEKLARAISLETRFARPTDSDATDLNAALSPRFFDLQDQLKANATALANFASLRDAKAMSKAFGGLTATCVACHAAYLEAR